MASKAQVPAITGHMSLAGVGHDWTDDCFLIYRKATRREIQAIDTTGLSDIEADDVLVEFCKQHFVRGQFMVLDDSGTSSLAPMKPAHLDSFSINFMLELFANISGARSNPKDTPTDQPAAERHPKVDETTEPTSSEAS